MLWHTWKTLGNNFRNLKRYREGMMDKAKIGTAPKSNKDEDEGMFVNGDVTFTDNRQNETPVVQQKTGMGTAAKLTAVAMLMTGLPGAAIAWNLPAIIEAMKSNQPTIEKPSDTDTDTNLEVGLGGGTVVE